MKLYLRKNYTLMDDFHREYEVNIDKVDKIECIDFHHFDVYTINGDAFKGIIVYSKNGDPNNLYEEEREFLWRFGINRYDSCGGGNGKVTWKRFA